MLSATESKRIRVGKVPHGTSLSPGGCWKPSIQPDILAVPGTLVKASGAECFPDLKLHDIPETVSRAVKQGMNLGANFMTIHASGGPAMIQAAVEASRSGPRILAVTALTSLDDSDCLKVYGHERQVMVVQDLMYLARMTHGFVCSAQEVAEGRATYPNHFFLVPGIRPAGFVCADQKATGTPRQAIRDGASLDGPFGMLRAL